MMMKKKFDPKKFGKVAVLMGGLSSEREISIESGMCVLNSMLKSGIDAYKVDVDIDIAERLSIDKPDLCFIILHGTNGEDGVIQSVLDVLHIKYVSSNASSSALTMNKRFCKSFLRSINIPVQSDLQIREEYVYPICVKPVDSGSSCGVSLVKNENELNDAITKARKYSSEIMFEPWVVDAREFAVGVLGDCVLPVVEIKVKNSEFYDYDAKYLSSSTEFVCPAEISEDDRRMLMEYSLKAFKETGCSCWGRVDFLQDKNGYFYCLEINTIPGMTTHSLVPMAAAAVGISFDELIIKILECGL